MVLVTSAVLPGHVSQASGLRSAVVIQQGANHHLIQIGVMIL
jgi:hypothetical protein